MSRPARQLVNLKKKLAAKESRIASRGRKPGDKTKQWRKDATKYAPKEEG